MKKPGRLHALCAFGILICLPSFGFSQTITPQSIAIIGPDSVNENGQALYCAEITYSDSSTKYVTAQWTNHADNSTALVDLYHFIAPITNGNSTTKLSVQYTESSQTVTATKTINVLETPLTGTGASQNILLSAGPNPEGIVGYNIDTATGAQIDARSVLSFKGGQPFSLNLCYNSLFTQTETMFGYGWRSDIEAFITFDDTNNTATVDWGPGQQSRYLYVSDTFTTNGNAELYVPINNAARRDTLTRSVTHDLLGGVTTNSIVLTRGDGTVFTFDPGTGSVASIRDKTGHAISFNYGTTTLSAGQAAGSARVQSIFPLLSNKAIDFAYQRNQILTDYAYIPANGSSPAIYVKFNYDGKSRLSSVTRPFKLDSTTYTSSRALAPPDNNSTGDTIDFQVTRTNPIGEVGFEWDNVPTGAYAQLVVKLISPQGTVHTLVKNGDPDFVAGRMTFFSDFEGENPQGTWKLVAVDNVAGSTFSIPTVKLEFSDPTYPTHFTYDDQNHLTSVHDGIGQVFADTYDANGRVVSQDDGVTTNKVATLSYDESTPGIIKTTYTNRVGDKSVYEYDRLYQLTSVTDQLGNIFTFTYDNRGNRLTATDPLNQTTQYQYDSNDNLTSVTDPEGNVTSYEYDSNRNVTVIHDTLGHETTITYDSHNNPLTITDADGNQYKKTYNTYNQLASVTKPGDGTSYLNYDADRNLTVVTHPADQTKTITMNYDNIGNIISVIDAAGNKTTYQYSSTGKLLSTTDPAGNTQTTTYDARDRPIAETDKLGRTTYYEYDGNDNVIKKTGPMGNVTTFTYDGEDRLTSITDPLGRTSTITYDADGRKIAETDPLGHSVTFDYDADGNVTAQYDAKGVKIKSATYGADRELLSTTDAYGHSTNLAYDANGNLTSLTDPLNRKTSQGYDDDNRMTSVTDPLDRVSTKHYNPDGTVSKVDNPGSDSTLYYYDPANRLTEVWSGNLNSNPRIISYGYSSDGRDLISSVNDGTETEDNTYDGLGRRTSEKVLDSNGKVFETLHYTFDANGNLTKTSDDSGNQITRQFDRLNRVVQFTDQDGNKLLYTYDAAGQMTRLTYPDGKQVNYAYDAAGRLVSVTDWANRKTTISYNENNQITRIVFPNGTYRVMSYDNDHRLLHRADYTPSGSVIVEYNYSFDQAGQLTSLTPPTTSYTPTATNITYSSINYPLTYNGTALSTNLGGSTTYLPAGQSTMTANNAESNFFSAVYDPRGRLVSAGGVNYTYDLEDRVIATQDSAGTTRYVINPQSQLSQVLQATAPDGTVTRYVYGIGLLYDVTGNSIQVYHFDARGNTAALTDASGNVTQRFAYGPYGEEINPPANPTTPFRFLGLYGVETSPNGLCNLRYRFYSPALRRFISQDAYPGDAAAINSLNQFSYANGNPVSFQDPNGEFVQILVGALIGAAVGGGAVLIGDAIQHKKVDWGEVGAYAIGGAIDGALASSGVGIPLLIAGGAASGALTETLNEGFHGGFSGKRRFNPLAIGESAAFGAVLTAGGEGAGVVGRRIADRAFGKAGLKIFGTYVVVPFRKRILYQGRVYGSINEIFPSLKRKLSKTFVDRLSELPTRTAGQLAKNGYGRKVAAFTSNLNLFGVVSGSARRIVSRDRYEALREYLNGNLAERRGPYLHFSDWISSLTAAGVPVPNSTNVGMAGFQ